MKNVKFVHMVGAALGPLMCLVGPASGLPIPSQIEYSNTPVLLGNEAVAAVSFDGMTFEPRESTRGGDVRNVRIGSRGRLLGELVNGTSVEPFENVVMGGLRSGRPLSARLAETLPPGIAVPEDLPLRIEEETSIDGLDHERGGLAAYRILVLLPDRVGSTWQPLCDPRGDHGNLAIVLRGRWMPPHDDHTPSDSHFTLACADSAAGKCALDFGYHPDVLCDTHGCGTRLHETCVRAVRADFCGTGEPFTVEGARIRAGDSEGIRPPAGLNLEAHWGPDGATCVESVRDTPGLNAREQFETLWRACSDRLQSRCPAGGPPARQIMTTVKCPGLVFHDEKLPQPPEGTPCPAPARAKIRLFDIRDGAK